MSSHDVYFRKVFARLNELERRLNNLIIPGKVLALSEDKRKVKVKHGSCETPFIKWLSNYAGQIREYRAPSVGEQCLLLNLTGGDDTSACFALMGVDTIDFQLPSNNPNEHKIIYPNGTHIVHNHEENRLTISMPSGSESTITVPDKITIESTLTKFSGDIEVDGNIKSHKDITDKHNSMDHMRDQYDTHTHNGVVGLPAKKMK